MAAVDARLRCWFEENDGGSGAIPRKASAELQAKLFEALKIPFSLEQAAEKGPVSVDVEQFCAETTMMIGSVQEERVVNALDGMIKKDLPPVETGDPVRDINAYRRYHGMDRVWGYLLQSLIMDEPENPVQALIEKVEEMGNFADLRREHGDKPSYHGVI